MLISEGYIHWTISKIIDEHKEELFDFQNTLDEVKSKIIFEIRKHAQNLLPTYELQYSKFKEKLEDLDYEDNREKRDNQNKRDNSNV